MDIVPLMEYFPEWGYNFAIFDFAGTGKSEGNYITLGYNEEKDVKVVLSYLRRKFNFKRFILWGRSMGAVTALYYMNRNFDPSIFGLILDSPYSDLEQLAKHTSKLMIKLPDFLLSIGLNIIEMGVHSKANIKFS